MDHATVLERCHELSNVALTEIHMLLARADADGAADALDTVLTHLATLAEEDEGGEASGPHEAYLAEHKTLADQALGEIGTLLGAGEPQLASVVVRNARAAIDTLWAERVQAAQLTVRP